MKKFTITLNLILIIANTAISQTKTSNIPNYKFETIEKIRLGLSKEKYLNEMKLLKIKNQVFSTNLFMSNKLSNENQQETNLINFYYTQTFNFDEFKVISKLIEHPTLIHSESIDNKHISSIILLLGHTGEAADIYKKDSIKSRVMYYRQDINQDLFFKIIDLYVQKYGQPEMLQDSTKQIKYYKLFKNNVLTENTKSYNNFILRWKTEFFNIEIFPGFNNNAFFIPNEWYSTSTNWESSNLDEKPLEYNQKKCFTFPFVKYELNEKALKMLVMNKLRI